MTWNKDFETAFHPRSVAFVGISKAASRAIDKPPESFIMGYEQLGFKGKIYPVHPTAEEIMGYKAYPSVTSLPERPDLVVICVPAPALPGVLEDCIKANARNIHIFTAGLEETAEKDARELASRVRQIISRGGLRVIGPNCMGLYVPEAGIGPYTGLSQKSGPVSFVSQSGGHINWLTHYGPNYGIYFNKVISYGNAYVLDSTDFLEYMLTDDKTSIICMYLEGVKDGARLLRLVKEAQRKKPVIIWKAGLTLAGSRAAASHTASLAGQARMWQTFFAQSGAIPVFSLEEMAELVMTFLYVKPLRGNRVGLVALGGGASVAAADVCNEEGLEVPALARKTINALKGFVSLAGASIMNPLDTGLAFRNIAVLQHEIELVAADPSIDVVIVMPHMDVVRKANPAQADDLIKYLSDIAVNGCNGKSVVIVFQSFSNSEWEGEMRSRLLVELPKKGVAVYQSLKAASRALGRYSRYSH